MNPRQIMDFKIVSDCAWAVEITGKRAAGADAATLQKRIRAWAAVLTSTELAEMKILTGWPGNVATFRVLTRKS